MLEFLQLEVEPEFPVLSQDVGEEVVLAALHRLKLSHAQLIVTLLTLHTDSVPNLITTTSTNAFILATQIQNQVDIFAYNRIK